MSSDPREIIGSGHSKRLDFLRTLLMDELIFEESLPNGIELNYLGERDISGHTLDLGDNVRRHCFYQEGCPGRLENGGFFEIIETTDYGITRYFLHKQCANALISKTKTSENT